VSHFVKALLDLDKRDARDALARLAARYPLAVTRRLARAKEWIRQHARPVVSSRKDAKNAKKTRSLGVLGGFARGVCGGDRW
jgi:hypothetical protein